MKRALAILSFLIPACVWGQVLPRPSETVHRKGTYRWTSEPETVLTDLGEVMDIHTVRTSFMQNAFTAMFTPETYEIRASADGVEFKTLSSSEPAADKSTAYTIEELGWDGDARARFIQVKAAHPSGWCWLMCDEIIVR